MSTLSNQAAWINGKGQPLTVSAAPMPQAGVGEILVRSRAIAMNPIDGVAQTLGGMVTPWVTYPAILGSDVAGEVVAVVGPGPPGAVRVGGPDAGDVAAELVGEGRADELRDLDLQGAVAGLEPEGARDGAGERRGRAVGGGRPHDDEGVADELRHVAAGGGDGGEDGVEGAVEAGDEGIDALQAEALEAVA